MTITKRDVVTTGSALLISQYVDKPRIEAVLSASLSSQQSLDDATVDVESLVLNLDDAQGAQLDICGSILDEPRNGRSDIIYRRILKTRVLVYRSQGRTEDLIQIVRTFQDLFVSGTTTPDSNSEIYVVGPNTGTDEFNNPISQNREFEINIFPEDDNLYTDPKPFLPDVMHDLLLESKGAGEKMQSVYPIVGPNENPLEDSLRLFNNVTGGLPPSLGSIHSTGSAGLPDFGAKLGHRRNHPSTFTANIPLEAIEAPTLEPSSSLLYLSGTYITASAGTWSGLPEKFTYSLYRSTLVVSGYDEVSLDTINSYQIQEGDLWQELKVREWAVRGLISASADTNTIGVTPATFDDSLWGWWNPLVSETSSDGLRYTSLINRVSDTNNLTNVNTSSQPTVTEVLGREAAYLDGAQLVSGTGGDYLYYDGEAYNTNAIPTGVDVEVIMMVQPTDYALDADNQTDLSGTILFTGDGEDALQTRNTIFFTTGSTPEYAMDNEDLYPPVTSLSGGVALADTPTLIWARFAGTGSGMWVNDMRDGQQVVTGTVVNFDSKPFRTQQSWFFNSDHQDYYGYQGLVWEMAIRTGSLSSEADRNSWVAYLNDRYGTSFVSGS